MKLSRRKFIMTALLATPFAIAADARVVEPEWVKITRLRLTDGTPAHRFVHFSDLHHKGDRAHTRSVIEMINSLSPDFVCFTGDLIEQAKYLPEALKLLSGIKSPLYGVPGNHDYTAGVSFIDIARCFAATGGAWLMNEQATIANGKLNLIGIAQITPWYPPPKAKPGMTNLLLFHYPVWANRMGDEKFDLMLAGHSHGCQVRIPFYGPIVRPFAVGEYDLGLYQTKSGPLYVTSGIGWFPLPVRFNCRPEIAVIEI
ncbi:MAG TPA: metallophosphoesterase [Pseudomonadales bacterium]|nr:metallophosphoesterase [Pseudomonadales bacterium]